jgi:prepilin-type N-terminal cleavage/methylation domain-containing protein
MLKNKKNAKGFTLIELLVVIAIIAILAVVVVLTLNPAELLRQSRDSNRISDFATLKSAISLYSEDVSTSSATSLGAANTIYGSATTTPTDASFISTLCSSTVGSSGGWGFAAADTIATGTTSRLVNGTGWLGNINFSLISSGAPIGALPVDPVNVSPNIYTFAASTTAGTWKLASKMESIKYSQGGSNDVESGDGGTSLCTYEQGTGLTD